MTGREVRSWLTVRRKEWAPGHFIWPLLEHDGMSVRLEAVPVGGGFDTHRHPQSVQFFFILEGVAEVEVEGDTVQLAVHEGLEVAPGEWHRIENVGEESLLFLIVAAPRAVPVTESDKGG